MQLPHNLVLIHAPRVPLMERNWLASVVQRLCHPNREPTHTCAWPTFTERGTHGRRIDTSYAPASWPWTAYHARSSCVVQSDHGVSCPSGSPCRREQSWWCHVIWKCQRMHQSQLPESPHAWQRGRVWRFICFPRESRGSRGSRHMPGQRTS